MILFYVCICVVGFVTLFCSYRPMYLSLRTWSWDTCGSASWKRIKRQTYIPSANGKWQEVSECHVSLKPAVLWSDAILSTNFNIGMLPLTSKDGFKSDDFKPGVKLKSRLFEWIKYDDLKALLLSSIELKSITMCSSMLTFSRNISI